MREGACCPIKSKVFSLVVDKRNPLALTLFEYLITALTCTRLGYAEPPFFKVRLLLVLAPSRRTESAGRGTAAQAVLYFGKNIKGVTKLKMYGSDLAQYSVSRIWL